MQCVGFWRENLRSYLITYDELDPISKYRCWVSTGDRAGQKRLVGTVAGCVLMSGDRAGSHQQVQALGDRAGPCQQAQVRVGTDDRIGQISKSGTG